MVLSDMLQDTRLAISALISFASFLSTIGFRVHCTHEPFLSDV